MYVCVSFGCSDEQIETVGAHSSKLISISILHFPLVFVVIITLIIILISHFLTSICIQICLAFHVQEPWCTLGVAFSSVRARDQDMWCVAQCGHEVLVSDAMSRE